MFENHDREGRAAAKERCGAAAPTETTGRAPDIVRRAVIPPPLDGKFG